MATEIPYASFNEQIEKLVATTPDPFVLQIGAMDGKRFDLLHPHLTKGGWKGLLVEPIPDMFALLQQTYAAFPDLQLVNCAVTEQTGPLTMHRVDPAAVAANLIPEEALGISSSDPTGGVLLSQKFANRYPEVAAKYILKEEVQGLALADLLAKHQVTKIDFVMIDTEGYDWKIAKQIDLTRYNPKAICLEHSHLSNEIKRDCMVHFVTAGYKFGVVSEDMENLIFYDRV